ncbi:MAG TPA: glycosyltransferase [Methanoculleus sp.]|nr:glycosyltransferase [Methanoculleus sp.]
MTKAMKFSIITPSYNQGVFIEETILSVLNQEWDDIELIVMDGGSKDNTLEILSRYDQRIIWRSEPDNGQTDAINKGLRLCTGDIIAYLNSDDTYEPGVFRLVADHFAAHPECDMVFGAVHHIDPASNVIETLSPGPLDLEEYLRANFYLPQPTVFFRRRVFEEIGFFDDSLNLGMDLDYWLRVVLKFRIDYIPKVLANARIYPEAKSSAMRHLYVEERRRILDKFFSSPDVPEEIRAKKDTFYSNIYLHGSYDNFCIGHYRDCLHYLNKSIRTDPRNVVRPKNYVLLAKKKLFRKT